MKKIAVVGAGISGLSAAHLLSDKHDVCVFEANDYLGGHTATKAVREGDRVVRVDTGFIVFNYRTYPNFIGLLKRLNVEPQKSTMSFSVQHLDSQVEYSVGNLNTLFIQRRNLFKLKHWQFLFSIIHFNINGKKLAAKADQLDDISLEQYIQAQGYNDYFKAHYLYPMVSAIWSAEYDSVSQFPLKFFLRFFNHHGLFNNIKRPDWYVIEGGSDSYVPALTANINRILTNSPVQSVKRLTDGVEITVNGETEKFDEVVLACHSDQALQILSDASDQEQAILSQLPYQTSDVVLHTDTSLLPSDERAWSSWNYRVHPQQRASSVTYNMNLLQSLDSTLTYCVSLNETDDIDEQKILGRYSYAHPVFSLKGMHAQQQRDQICGHNHTHFCGAYWYNGFHEDGLRSAIDVAKRFGIDNLDSGL